MLGLPYPPFPLSPPSLPNPKTTRLMHTTDTPHIHHYRLLPLLSRPPFLPTPHKSNPDLLIPVFETSTAQKSPRRNTPSISTSTSISNLLTRHSIPPFFSFTLLKQHYPPFTCRALISWPLLHSFKKRKKKNRRNKTPYPSLSQTKPSSPSLFFFLPVSQIIHDFLSPLLPLPSLHKRKYPGKSMNFFVEFGPECPPPFLLYSFFLTR